MKNLKRLLAVGLATVMTAGMLTGCGGSGSQTSGTDGGQTPTGGKTGSVYYLNFKPEQDKQWQELAAAYKAETGVEVTVVTAASGEYETTLMS